MAGVLTKLIQRGIAAGEILSEDSASQIAEYLMVSMRGLVYNWATMEQSYDLPERMAWYMPRLLKAYFPDKV